ncbi:MAG: hypothetical protein KAQ62_11965, partial [Cyclobacteriaceae bacterium]|nr:hypothetical protein [Cyclobacteriaceae bacterium]
FLSPSPALDLYVSDQNNMFVEQYDSVGMRITYATIGSISFIKDSNENKGQFVGDITNYIHNLTSGNSTDSLLLIGQTSLWNSVLTVNQVITPKDDIKIKVYYSTLQ